MSPAERAQIQKSLESCKGIVQDLQSELSKFGEASHVDKGIRAKLKRSVYVHFNLLASTSQDSYSARRLLEKRQLRCFYANRIKDKASNGISRLMRILGAVYYCH